MAKYNKARDVAEQQGRRIEGEIQAATKKYGSVYAMHHAEQLAERDGRLFQRPSSTIQSPLSAPPKSGKIVRSSQPSSKTDITCILSPAQYRSLRISLSLSQINLARELGVSRDTIIRLEKGGTVRNEQAYALLYLKHQHDSKGEDSDT